MWWDRAMQVVVQCGVIWALVTINKFNNFYIAAVASYLVQAFGPFVQPFKSIIIYCNLI